MNGYKVRGFDLTFYCKKSEINIGMSNYKCVLSFGAGMKKFCMTAFYDKQKNPTTIYINNVENNDLCVSNGLLSNYDNSIEFVIYWSYCMYLFFCLSMSIF